MKKQENDFNEYDFAEAVGREKAMAMLQNETIVNVEDKYAPYDLSGTTLTHRYYIEVKDRKFKSNAYDTDMLEYDKQKRMQNADPEGLHYYFCTFSDGKGRLYLLNKIKIEDLYVTLFNCPSSTVENKGIKQKICYELPVGLAKNYRL